MERACICVADASRARLFTFDEFTALPGERTQALRERIDLTSPARRHRPGELLSETRPGSHRAPTGRGYAVSDHREAYLARLDRAFAEDIAGETAGMVEDLGCDRILLVASPTMLDQLRRALGTALGRRTPCDELARDYTLCTPAELHDHLAARGLLPARERLSFAPPP